MKQILAFTTLAVACACACADEGLWTYNDFPAARVASAYGFAPDAAWLDHLRHASLRIGDDCSGSLVSARGLVATNHHCVRDCLDTLSAGAGKVDLHRDGFVAHAPADEARCPGLEVDQLVEIRDVTPRLRAATEGIPPADFATARRAASAAIEHECAAGDDVHCEVVPLWNGGRYDLYRYRHFSDVRLAFAPEDRIAYFGGDADNFAFPRYDLDVALLRLYGRDGQPVSGTEHLDWANRAPAAGELTFVSGNPGSTSRTTTLSQLRDDRDVRLANRLLRMVETRGLLQGYASHGDAARRDVEDVLFSLDNTIKAFRGRRDALIDPAFFGQLEHAEADLRARIAADPALAARYGSTWDDIAAVVQRAQETRPAYDALELGELSDLFWIARNLVREADESAKPDAERLSQYTTARMAGVQRVILSQRPIHDDLEIVTLAWSLDRIREQLGPDDPAVRRIFGTRTATGIATAAVRGTRLKDIVVDAKGTVVGGYRRELLDGGPAAVAASHDPMIELARAIDPAARAARHAYETEVDGPLKRLQQQLADAHFAAYGPSAYPDGTFTPRLSYGAVQGWRDKGRAVDPFTALGGVFDRATGAEPFQLPDSWLRARPKLDAALPFDFVTTNDIIGGSSGSPVVERHGQVLGLVFDGNAASIGGVYGFDATANRAIAVSTRAVLEALAKVYAAPELVDELTRPAAAR